MSLPVFVTDAVTGTTIGAVVTLDGAEGRHAVQVVRTRVGDRLQLVDGAGTRATCIVESVQRGSLGARVDDLVAEPRPRPAITVVQAIPKGDRGELAVELLTEIGVDRVVPWAAERCVAVWRGDRAARGVRRWRAAALAATKQSRRSWLPSVTDVASTVDVSALAAAADVAVVLHEEAVSSLDEVAAGAGAGAGAESIVVVVGPEGGLSEAELDALAGARAVRLGSEVLRTSTAGVAAVAALLSRTERWATRR